jgi:hypothetical protein
VNWAVTAASAITINPRISGSCSPARRAS